jgi:hypothetical protein
MTQTTRPLVRIHNTATDEVIDREMTDAEFAQMQLDATQTKADQAEAEAKAQAKVALLNKLGITAEEARLLLE